MCYITKVILDIHIFYTLQHKKCDTKKHRIFELHYEFCFV